MTSDASAPKPTVSAADEVDSEPAAAKPDTSKPDTSKPDTSKPDTSKPDTSKPDTSKPVDSKPVDSKPDSDLVAGESGPSTAGAGAPASTGAGALASTGAGAPAPAGLTIGRPPEMYLGAAFLTLAALPMVLAGLTLLLQLGGIGAAVRQKVLESGAGVDPGSVILLVRVVGGLLLLVGLVYIGLTWFALKPRRWARAGAGVLAAVEMLLLVAGMVVTAVDPVSVGVILLAGAGAALLYLPRSEEFLLAQR